MAYPDKVLWRDMHQKAPDEFLTRNGTVRPLSFVLIILNSECDRHVRHAFNTTVADSDPVGVLSKIPDYGFCSIKRFFTMRDPFLFFLFIQQFPESIMIPVWSCGPMELKPALFPKLFQL